MSVISDLAGFAMLMAGIAFGALSAWIGLQIYNELVVQRMNQAVVDALCEGTYRNSYRYRPRRSKKK